MATQVIKKDGTKEPFDPEKIRRSILMACQDAGIADDRTNQVVEQVTNVALSMAEGIEEIATGELKTKILSELDTVEPSVSAAWRKHVQEKK